MSQIDAPVTEPVLYTHKNCPEWGLAILAWDRGPRRAYQFEDGKLRVFRDGYYDLITEADAPIDRARSVTRDLQRALGRAERRSDATRQNPEMSFADQLRVFEIQFEDGFGKEWLETRRGRDANRRLKRHRDPAIEAARTRLAETALDGAIAAGQDADIVSTVVDILRPTNLISKKQLEPLVQMPPQRYRAFVSALADLLYGDANYVRRFERFVATVALTHSRGPSWQLVTALPALVYPHEHICVRPATIRRQAAWMAPRLTFTKTPSGQVYKRLLRMARAVADELARAGHQPADLWDVYDFMLESLRPSARKLLEH